ncbi:multi-sensor signal transduction histidine kinase [Stanieria cyanosphaera PCC 7437]|uniref:histidine kinase n=2 Tax=Stanieria cyanosphaera TaxID=102116 RepID=K9XXT2_STAC7|nr:multi-sensor signal transduction histidine kinase [Stanieria cyanosphaera PCC 7437]
MPHGMCYLWKPGLVGLHLLSNAVIALSYFSIPFTLVYILRKRPDIPFNGIFLLFAAFIVSCGIGHAFDIWTLWHPNYWLAGNIKAMTASVSLLTAIALIQTIPQIIALPSPQQMQQQIREREQAETELIKERQFLQALLNNLSDGIVACDQNGLLTLFNQATQTFHGLPKQSLPSQDWAQYYDLYLPDGKTMMSSAEIPLFRALQGEPVRNVEMMIIPKQGKPRLLLANGDPIIAPDGEKLGAVVAMRDITERKQIEQALQESKARFTEAFGNAAIGMAIVSLEGQWLEINTALCQMLGYSEADLLATNFQSITYPEDLAQDLLCVKQLISGEIESGQLEKRYLNKQGEIVWVSLSVSVVKNEQNQPLYFVALIENITNRKQIEQDLQESERRFRAIFNSMFQFIGLLKPDGTLLEANQTALDFGGFRLEEIVNRPFWEISWWQINAQTQQQLQQAIMQAASGEFVRYEVDILGANNQIATIDFSLKPVLDENGQISLLIPEGRNITESKKIQEKLQRNEQRWQLAIQSTGDGIWDWNVQTNEVYYSPRWKEMRGYQNDEIRGNFEQWAELIHSDDYEKVMSALEQHFTKQIPFRLEYRTLHRDSSYRWILVQGQAVCDEIGQILRMVGAETDITERKQAQVALAQLNEELEARVKQRTSQLEQVNKILLATTGQLEKRNQELDQFAYVASHDLKAPLRAIANLSEWLEEDLEDKLDDDTRHNLNLLRGRVHRLENLINGLLAYSRVGRVSSEFQLVSVERLLNEIIDSLVVPPEFKIEIIGKMPTFRTQLLPLQQTFSNLIDNAIKHHPRQDGKVSISVVEQENFYEFTVSDDGKGIDPKYHDRIFTIFQTLEARDNKESTGIGLSIVKKAVENQGGAITVESQVGEGTSFRFTWKKN